MLLLELSNIFCKNLYSKSYTGKYGEISNTLKSQGREARPVHPPYTPTFSTNGFRVCDYNVMPFLNNDQNVVFYKLLYGTTAHDFCSNYVAFAAIGSAQNQFYYSYDKNVRVNMAIVEGNMIAVHVPLSLLFNKNLIRIDFDFYKGGDVRRTGAYVFDNNEFVPYQAE